MADNEGLSKPTEEPEATVKPGGGKVSEAAVNGTNRLGAEKTKHRAGTKGRKRDQRKSSGGKQSKSRKKTKAKTRIDSTDGSDDELDTSSTEEDTDSSSDSSSDDQVFRKKSRHSFQNKHINVTRKGRKDKSARKVSESKTKKSGLAVARQDSSSESSSSSSSSDSDSSDDSEASDNQDEVAQDQEMVTELVQQVRDLQVQVAQLQQGYAPPHMPLLSAPPTQLLTQQGLATPGLGASGRNQLSGHSNPQRLNNNHSNTLGSLSVSGHHPSALTRRPGKRNQKTNSPDQQVVLSSSRRGRNSTNLKGKTAKKGDNMRSDFKRVDWVWDSTNYSYKLQDSVETSTSSQYDGFVFHVRRIFDPDGKYRKTTVDIKSKLLREALQDVMGNPKGVSLVDETPKLDPNLLFLYLDDFRAHLKELKKLEPAGKSKKKRKKNQARLDEKRKHLKVLIKYLDNDYEKIKSSLNPMLRNGLITFDLLWALWKPGTLGYASTYGNTDMPRVFKVESAERHSTLHKGEFYYLDGKYFEFDGKRFGLGHVSEDVLEFKGARKITSLPCYPLSYCTDEEKVREELIARGKKFVTLSGMRYKAYNGMAFMKRKKAIIRFNIQNSRIMIDPATFRRINPNYYVSQVRTKDPDHFDDDSSDDDDSDNCGSNDSSDDGDSMPKLVTRMIKDSTGQVRVIQVPRSQAGEEKNKQALVALPQEEHNADKAAEEENKFEDGKSNGDKDQANENGTSGPDGKEGSPTEKKDRSKDESSVEKDDEDPMADIKAALTDHEYLIASPVVLGFSFSEKQWLEFSVTAVSDIKWNDSAWDSLVLDPETKHLIKALVESRKYNPANTIDDVIQGKGKGLVSVLHGPPGTGKTLTAEGISELLKCPLYMASAGELGTDSRFLEHELQKILDICHTWGAILLLDEADVFLEKRNMQDIHRNALVSIFLRQLEYFQGILFLTTNRVETFDEAFQSRIHIALRYEKLDIKAKKAIFRLFIDKVKAYGRMEIAAFSENDLNALAKHDLNGREIKNVMGSAQDLALNKKEALGISHIRQVLEVHAKFGRDLKGGTGFEDAMRSYF